MSHQDVSVSDIRALTSLQEAKQLTEQLIPCDRRIPEDFWQDYEDKYRLLGLKACLIIFVVTGGEIVPRRFQMEATLALLAGKDSLVDVGTGYGKTLCLILPALLFPEHIAFVISPLKRLQALQQLEFEKYGISAISINEHTPKNDKLWKASGELIERADYTILIVQPEQLVFHGHWPRLALLLTVPAFTERIKRIHVDESHTIFTAGLPHYGLKPFRPAWGSIGELRLRLNKKIVFQALSGTQPSHIKSVIIKNLLMKELKLLAIKLSCNRPNITFAIHPIVHSLSDFRNLDFLIPNPYPAGFILPKTIVFHDDKKLVRGACAYMNGLLPVDLQGKGIIQYYHSDMSMDYLKAVFDDFASPTGTCHILHATEGASTGVDIRDITVVVQYGTPRDIPTCLQRGGRCGRDGITESIFLLLHEAWAKEVDLSTAQVTDDMNEIDRSDPDRPLKGVLSERSTKQERTGIAILDIIQNSNKKCIRMMYNNANGDESPDALTFTGKFCCNSDMHYSNNNQFTFNHFFPHKLLFVEADSKIVYYGENGDPNRCKLESNQSRNDKKRALHTLYRPVQYRASLNSWLVDWRQKASSSDALRSVRPASFILSDGDIKILSQTHPDTFTSPSSIGLLLEKSDEWRGLWEEGIYKCIQAFDQEVKALTNEAADEKKENLKRAKIEEKQKKYDANEQLFQRLSQTTRDNISSQLQGISMSQTPSTSATATGTSLAPISGSVRTDFERETYELQQNMFAQYRNFSRDELTQQLHELSRN